jgi:hypothetical protein
VPRPKQDDAVTTSGAVIPQTCVQVNVKNTSNGFTGWVAPTVEFVKGYSLAGQLLDTEAADATGGDSGALSDSLAPGQSDVLYACPQNVTAGTYVTLQLMQVEYSAAGTGTTVQLQC